MVISTSLPAPLDCLAPLAQHLQSRQAKQAPLRPTPSTRKARRGKARLCSVACPVPPSQPPVPPSSSHPSTTAPRLLLFALAPASRSLCRPEPPSLSATGAVSVASHPHQLSAARSGKRDRRAIFAPLSTRPQKSSACPLSLPPCPCATEAEEVRARTAQTQDRRARQAAGLPGVTVTSWSLTGKHIVSGVLPSAPLSWAILSLGAHLRRQPRCITTTRPKRRPLPPTGFLHSARAAYTPPRCRLPTTTTGPVAHLFSPLLIFCCSAGRQ